MSAAEPQVAVDESTGVGLPVPEGWERVDAPGSTLVVAGPPVPATADGTTSRPRLDVLVVPADDAADVRTLGAEALAAVTADVEAHVVAYDLWPAPDGTDGRRLEVATQDGAVPVVVRQWITLSRGTVVTVTATLPVADLIGLAPLVDDAVARLRLPEGAA